MDLQMAPVDGVQATREIRARYPDVEVVALTSFSEEERVQAALQAGASGYLLKDSDPDEVVAAVRAAHRGELQIDPAVARGLLSSLAAAPQGDPTRDLTPREVEVLRLLGIGKPNKEIAAELEDKRANGADTRVEHPRKARPHITHTGSPLGGSRRARGLPGLSTLASARPAGGGAHLPQDGGSRPCRTRSAPRILSLVESAFALKPPDFDSGTAGPAVSVLAGGAHRTDARLLPPPRPAGLVPRPLAVRRLLETRELPIALLVAPAGLRQDHGPLRVGRPGRSPVRVGEPRRGRPPSGAAPRFHRGRPRRERTRRKGSPHEPFLAATGRDPARPSSIAEVPHLPGAARGSRSRRPPCPRGVGGAGGRAGDRPWHAAGIAAGAGVTPRARRRRGEPACSPQGGGAAGRGACDVAVRGRGPARRCRTEPRPGGDHHAGPPHRGVGRGALPGCPLASGRARCSRGGVAVRGGGSPRCRVPPR